MDRYYGFDLGDAESAVTYLKKNEQMEPKVVPVRESGSFITAYARLRTGELLIGEEACYTPDATERRLRFKSRFLTDPSSARDIRSFAGGVLGELYMSGGLIKGEDCCFYIGCPAGWDRSQRERYREIFENAGFPPVRIISESRAALISACQSRHFQVGYDILSRPVLVVDMGSSTTDFAYISSGREVELQTAGEVALGGGIMDELLLDASVEASPDKDELRRVFEQSPPWRTYCEFAARRLKEKYFADEDYWRDKGCTQTVTVMGKKRLRLELRMNAELADRYCPIGVQHQIDIALEEIFVNVCSYAYQDAGEPGKVRVEYVYYADPNSLTVSVTDWGVPFDPLAHDDPKVPTSAAEAPIGGLGILMVKRLTDDVSYVRDDDANVIAFKKAW